MKVGRLAQCESYRACGEDPFLTELFAEKKVTLSLIRGLFTIGIDDLAHDSKSHNRI